MKKIVILLTVLILLSAYDANVYQRKTYCPLYTVHPASMVSAQMAATIPTMTATMFVTPKLLSLPRTNLATPTARAFLLDERRDQAPDRDTMTGLNIIDIVAP